MKNLLFYILFISVFSFSQEEKRLALVIGNSEYIKGPLKNPVNDAKLIAKALDSLGFEVLEYYNLTTQRQLKKAILEFGAKRDSANVGFVYYAGHGVQVNNENYLLPTQEEYTSQTEVIEYAVSVQTVLRALKSDSNQVNILVLDACRDNPFESNWNTTRSLKSQGLAKIPPPTGSLIAFSTDSGQTAPDGDGDNSVYTISLAKNMLLEDTSIDQVFRNVRAEVLAQSNGMQRPVESTQLTGQTFYINNLNNKIIGKRILDLFSLKKYTEILDMYITMKPKEMSFSVERIYTESLIKLKKFELAELKLDELKINYKSNLIDLLKLEFEFYKIKGDLKNSLRLISRISDLSDNLLFKSLKDLYSMKYHISIKYPKFDTENTPLVAHLIKSDEKFKKFIEQLKLNLSKLYENLETSFTNEDLILHIIDIEYQIAGSFKKASDEYNNSYINIFSLYNRLLQINPRNYTYNYNMYYYLDRDKKYNKSPNSYTKKNNISDQKIKQYLYSAFINSVNNKQINLEYAANFLKNKGEKIEFFDKLINSFPDDEYILERAKLYDEDNFKLYERDVLNVINKKIKTAQIKDLNSELIYDVIMLSNSISNKYVNRKEFIKSSKLLLKSHELIDFNEIEINKFNIDETYLYGENYQTIAENNFGLGKFDSITQYVSTQKRIWSNFKMMLSIENDLKWDYIMDNWDDLSEKYSSFLLAQYASTLYGYALGSNIMYAEIDLINQNYNEAYNKIIYSLDFTNIDYLGFTYLNLALLLNKKEEFNNYITKFKSDPSKKSSNDNKFRLLIYNVRKGLYKNDNYNKGFIDYIASEDNEDIVTDINKSKDLIIESINILMALKQNELVYSYVNRILDSVSENNLDSAELLYKISFIKFKNNEKFEAYYIVKKALEYFNDYSEQIIERRDLGYLNYSIAKNFDGLTPLTKIDLIKLIDKIKGN